MREKKGFSPLHIIYIAIFSAIMVICSWTSIPSPIPFTLQTMGVVLNLGLLGGKLGTATIGIYLLLGSIGLPVFSSFGAGFGHLLGATGGFNLGFIFMALIIWLGTAKTFSYKRLFIFSIIGLISLYIFGTAWYCYIYMEKASFLSAFLICVLPFIVPDIIKIILGVILVKKIKPYI